MAVPANAWLFANGPDLPPDTDYSKKEERLKSFIDWPRYYTQKPAELSESGFYMIERHAVKCFLCGLELHEWERNDIPAEEHFRWNPHCEFNNKVMKKLSTLKNEVMTENDKIDIENIKASVDPLIERLNKMTIDDLQKKYIDVVEKYRCKICLDNQIAMIFIPCNALHTLLFCFMPHSPSPPTVTNVIASAP